MRARPDEAHGGAPDGGESDDVVDAEILDAADVSAAVDEAFADDDPLALALNQRDEYLDSLRRLQAEFENYKKRVVKQQSDQVARAAGPLVEKVLPVLDTLDLATQHLGDAESAGRPRPGGRGRPAARRAGQGGPRADRPARARSSTPTPTRRWATCRPRSRSRSTPTPTPAVSRGGAAAGGSGEPVVGQVMRAGYRWRGTVVRPAMVMVRG